MQVRVVSAFPGWASNPQAQQADLTTNCKASMIAFNDTKFNLDQPFTIPSLMSPIHLVPRWRLRKND